MDLLYFLVVGAFAALAFFLGYRAQACAGRPESNDPYIRYRDSLADRADLDLDNMKGH